MKSLTKAITSSITRGSSSASSCSHLKNASIIGLMNNLNLLQLNSATPINLFVGNNHHHQLLSSSNRRNYHTTSSNMFFDLKKAKKQAAETAVFSEEEQQELIKNYQVLEDKFKSLTEKIIEYRRENPTPVQLKTNHLFNEVCDIVNFCYKVFPKTNDPVNLQLRFFKSNVGMKSFVLMKKVELLLLKIINQEWVPVSTLKSQFEEKKITQTLSPIYPPDVPMDETLYLFAAYDAALSYAAYIQPNIRDMVRIATKENVIAGALFLFNRLKDIPVLTGELRKYAQDVFEDYEFAKTAYTTAKPITNEQEFHSNTENAYSYLGKTFTEHEFDFFEDIETNIPINLGVFIKALKSIVDFDSHRHETVTILDECLKADPKNIYIHYMKATCLDILNGSEVDINSVHNNYSDSIHHLEKALKYLSNTPMLPLPTLSKTNFSHETEEPEKQVERINDLKFTPISFSLALMYSRAAESGVSVDLRHIYGAKGIDYVRQAELYSRSVNGAFFYMVKGACYYSCDMFELAVNAYSSVERFESILDPSLIVDSICYASNCMISLGYSDKCLEAMDFYIEKYANDPRLLFQKLLCKDYMCRSKDELRAVLKEFEQLIESIQDLQITNPYVYARVNMQTEARINEIRGAIANPQVAERW